jgi:hypothetical protein
MSGFLPMRKQLLQAIGLNDAAQADFSATTAVDANTHGLGLQPGVPA